MNVRCVPADAFNIESDKVILKKYSDDLVSYLKADNSFDLTYSSGILSPNICEETYHCQDHTGFPYISVHGQLTYDRTNFRNFQYGAIRALVKKEDCNNDFAYQDFQTLRSTVPAGIYRFKVRQIDNSKTNILDTFNVVFELDDKATTVAPIVLAIQKALENDEANVYGLLCEQLPGDTIRIKTKNSNIGYGVVGYIEIATEEQDCFFSNYMLKINRASYFSAPDNDTAILRLSNLENKNNEVALIHKIDGNLYFSMTDKFGECTIEKLVCPWIWHNNEFIEIECNFDSSAFNVLVNGELKIVPTPSTVLTDTYEIIDIERDPNADCYLSFIGKYNGVQGDAYGVKTFAIFNKKQHCSYYDSPIDIDRYNQNAYIEYDFGNIEVFKDKKLSMSGTGSFKLEMLDGSYPLVESNSIPDFIEKVNNFTISDDPDNPIAFEVEKNLVFKITYLTPNSSIDDFNFYAGTEKPNEDDPYNFEDRFMWIRRQLGYPQVACELTDEQIYDAMCRAVNKYNKWRNANESISVEHPNAADKEDITKLRRGYSPKEGNYFILPADISEKDVIDIIFQPKYTSAWFNSGSDFMNNIMAQTFLGQPSDFVPNVADYFIYRSTLNDVSNILGTQVSWRIYNGHLFITPYNTTFFDNFSVIIKYRRQLSIEEIRNTDMIWELALGYSMVTLGTIRGTFAGGVSVGDTLIQLNGSDLIERGNTIITNVINDMKKEQKPLLWWIT